VPAVTAQGWFAASDRAGDVVGQAASSEPVHWRVEFGFRLAGNEVSPGSVVLLALLLSGSQFTLFAMWFDME
jgi:hypothetical protein